MTIFDRPLGCRACTVLFLGFPSLREPRGLNGSSSSSSFAGRPPKASHSGHIDEVASVQRCVPRNVTQAPRQQLAGHCVLWALRQLPSRPTQLLPACMTRRCVEVVQKRMRQFDGSFVQFRCDEKGFVAICAFGLPGRSHEDNPARGIQAALAVVEGVKVGGRATHSLAPAVVGPLGPCTALLPAPLPAPQIICDFVWQEG